MALPVSQKIAINNAVSQYQRWLKALNADYAKVDGRSFSDLLSFSTRFSRLIYFYNLKNQIDGNWVEFFVQDPSIVIASINTCNAQYFEEQYCCWEKNTLTCHCFDEKFECLRGMCSVITNMAHEINGWLIGLRANHTNEYASQLYYEIENEIKLVLSEQLRKLKSYDKGAGLETALCECLNLNYQGLGSIWNLQDVPANGSIYQGCSGRGKINHAVPYFKPIFESFLYALVNLQNSAQSLLAFSLEGQNHKPQSAMYIAFARLFQYAQDNANTFSQRFIDFYYHDILQEYKLPSRPDKTFLSLTLVEDEEIPFSIVPAGTAFDAGQDENEEDIVFTSEKELIVSPAKLEQIKTLGVSQGKLILNLDEQSQHCQPDIESLIVPQQIISGNITKLIEQNENQEIDAEDDEISSYDQTAEPDGLVNWPPFGFSNTENSYSHRATLGFAIASENYLLQGGKRTVNTAFSLKHNPTLLKLLENISQLTGQSIDEVLKQVIEKSFSLYISTYQGWLPIEDFKASSLVFEDKNQKDQPIIIPESFSIHFTLNQSAPGFNAYNPDNEDIEEETEDYTVSDKATVLATNPSPKKPTLKIYLKQKPINIKGEKGKARIYPFSILSQLDIDNFSIQCQVDKLNNLTLENIDGEIDTSSPYPIFGALPVVQSTLSISNQEIFQKQIDSLKIKLKWFNLPQNSNGFYGYYKDYIIDIDDNVHPPGTLFNNQSFRNKIKVHKPGLWDIENADQEDYLFRTDKTGKDSVNPSIDGKLSGKTLFDQIKTSAHQEPEFYSPTESHIDITLTKPSYAFGNDLYTKNVLKSVIDDLPDPDKCTEKCTANLVTVNKAIAYIIEAVNTFNESTSSNTCIRKYINTAYALFTLYYRCKKSCSSKKGKPPSFSHEQTETLQLIKEQFQQLENLPNSELNSENITPIAGKISGEINILNSSKDEGETGYSPCDCCPPVLSGLNDLVTGLIVCLSDSRSHHDCLLQTLVNLQLTLEETHEKIFQDCMEKCMQIKDEFAYPNNPYLPQLEKLELCYSSYNSFDFNQNSMTEATFYHLLPFNSYNTVTVEEPEQQSSPLFPQFAYQGNLYLGFDTDLAKQFLSFLFQMSSHNSLGETPQCDTLPGIQFEYLNDNQWHCIGYKNVSDVSTHHLQASGIMEIDIPDFADRQSTIMPGQSHWLRLGVENLSSCFPDAINIFNNALLVKRDIEVEMPLSNYPLPANTIEGSLDQLGDIDSIYQPMESFSGKNRENRKEFETRLSERLRHKDRAILSWDYERLVLEEFPEIWKVKTLPIHDSQQGNQAGHVLVVVIPGPENRDIMSPITPAVSSERLQQIHDFLEARISPFITLKVLNPAYVHIEVTTEVTFTEPRKSGELIKQLNSELTQYLSPWFYNEAREKTEGFYVSEPYIKDFISNRPYIESIHTLTLNYSPNLKELSSQWYFLTSAASHKISELDALPCKKYKSTVY